MPASSEHATRLIVGLCGFAAWLLLPGATAAQSPGHDAAALWRQTIEAPAPPARLQPSSVPIYVEGDDALLAIVEPSDESAGPVRAWIERRGPTGLLWRYELANVPPGAGLETALSPPDGQGRAILAVTFQTPELPADDDWGRLLSIDLRAGTVDRVVPLRYPRIAAHGLPGIDDRLHVDGALRLHDGAIALFGGDGVGPYRWFAGLRGGDGGFLWDSGAPRRGYGETRAAREVPGGIELLVDAIAYTPDYRDRHLLIRLDRRGRIVSTADLAPLGNTDIAFAGNGLLVAAPAGRQREVSLHDARGAAKILARLPRDARFAAQAGPWLIFADPAGRHWFLTADGHRIGFPDGIADATAEGFYGIDAQGRPVKYVLQQRCLEQPSRDDCRRLELSLLRIDF